MSGGVVVVIRRARAEDAAARAALVRAGLAGHFWDAFFMFYFHELTLQGCVLGGAVLFIFMGASLRACAALPAAAAALVALAVLAAHLALAERQLQAVRAEMSGWVAEARAPLGAAPPPAPRLLTEAEARAQLSDDRDRPYRSQVVGTVSLSEWWGPRNSGWMHALSVHAAWRRRGVARALSAATRAASVAAGLHTLEAVTSAVQHAARTLLHAQGWELRGTYERPVVGAAATLHMAQLGLDLPHA